MVGTALLFPIWRLGSAKRLDLQRSAVRNVKMPIYRWINDTAVVHPELVMLHASCRFGHR